MSKSLSVLLGLLLSVLSLNSYAGEECGLVDNWGKVKWASTSFDLTGPTGVHATLKEKLLPQIVQKQLIATANISSSQKFENSAAGAQDAIRHLRQHSEGRELYILRAGIQGKNQKKTKQYSVVSYYGGGNHTGAIFKWGSSTPIAEIGDDDISCVSK